MRYLGLLTAFLLTGAVTAQADDGLLKWEGSLRFLTQSGSCQGTINLVDNQRVRYYPQIGAGPKTSFVMFHPHDTELIRFTDNGQFSGGANHYDIIRIGGGETLELLNGTFAQAINQMTQSPNPVTSAAAFVTLTANMQNYGGMSGCSVTFRATLVRIDAD